MLRPSRRLTIALLWLAIVLLPLRAGAVLLMPTLMLSVGATTTQATMPCHGVAADAAAAIADDASAQACPWCDLCQAHAPQAAWCGHVTADQPHVAPSSPPPAFASAVPDAPFRPPRPLA